MSRCRFDAEELKLLRSLHTPTNVQDFLDTMPMNFEEEGDTLMSPHRVLREKKAHCMEGALLAAAAFWVQGRVPLLLDLRSTPEDDDHVVALFRERERWGAVSKTNHAVLRWREPIFKDIHSLAASYFHEYFLDSGKKTLISFSEPFDIIKRFGVDWFESREEMDHIATALDKSKHFRFYPKNSKKFIKNATKLEIKASQQTQWQPKKTKG